MDLHFCRANGISTDKPYMILAAKITYSSHKCLDFSPPPTKSILCYTNDRYPQNTITQCYKVLKNLLNLPNGRIAKAKGRFLSPHIRAPFIRECAPFLKGGMDISDGILAEITRICAINHLFFKPCMPFFAPYLKPLLQSGESYEMLIAIDSKDFLRLKRKAARHRIKVCKLGTFTRQRQILPSFKHWH